MILTPGTILDRYALVAPVGEGGQATVWRASDRVNGRGVALKLVRLAIDDRVNERVRQEARALARLDHPSLLRCHGLFEDPERQLLGVALEWIDGATLDELAESAPLTRAESRWVLTHLASVLAYLHARGVVHRDVKPANVLCGARFRAAPREPALLKLADLGIAAPVGNPRPLTRTGLHIGTLMFMAPELLDPTVWKRSSLGGASPALDVFALGVLGWYLVYGQHPTGLGDDATTADLGRAYADYAEAPSAWLPPSTGDDALAGVLKRCLRLEAERRPTAEDVVAALR